MAHVGGPPPPPPPPNFRPPGLFPGGGGGGQRPQPPPGVRPPGTGGGHGPGPQLPPKIIQQSSRIRDITPQKLLTEADCLQKLTTYAAFSVRKVPALSPKERPSWARAEVTEDRLDQADIKKQIKKLGEKGKTVAEKRAALAQFQQGQVTALLDDLASKETDRNFEWSLVQMDRIEKEVPSMMKPGKKAIETVVMILYIKRAPLPGLNAVMMFQNIEKRRIDSLRPPPPPPQQHPPPPPHDFRPPSAHGNKMGGQEPLFVDIGKGHQKSPKMRHRDKRFHDRDDSSTGSSDSFDTLSDSESDASSSLDTSISARSNHGRRRNSRAATRSHSRHRPKYSLEDRRQSPERRPSDAYGVPHHPQQHHQQQGPQRPYVPDVPRVVPAFDPITSAYQAGKEDARAELGDRIQSPVAPQPVIIERIIERPPIERVIEQPRIERIVESPRAVVSYARLPERPRYSEPRYAEERYVDDIRSQEDEYLIRRREADDHAIMREERMRREAEEYIDRRPLDRPEFLPRRQSYSFRGDSSPSISPTRDIFDRRPSDPREREREFRRPEARRVFTSPISPHPFAAQNLPRRYPPSMSSASYDDRGW
ncbi:uncharacterized protein LY89DRAFT_729388 [Mollisia scopiformis]|uniref:Uncharacterized protein n=1 Tax=Mollisia scopiformis TaxID=149040 RepID=A0A194XQ71_MOLSC|nr:uncharacterized protein LY89DRAFT_729388 [Mollisia scopiformis]KUJ21892.1 hypothetical protein LY89DRAFT_729388 [Mollisia scopiformis]